MLEVITVFKKDCRLYAPHCQIWPEYKLETASCLKSIVGPWNTLLICQIKKRIPLDGALTLKRKRVLFSC